MHLKEAIQGIGRSVARFRHEPENPPLEKIYQQMRDDAEYGTDLGEPVGGNIFPQHGKVVDLKGELTDG